MRWPFTAISVSGRISPDWTHTQRPPRMTRSADSRPMATSISLRLVSIHSFVSIHYHSSGGCASVAGSQPPGGPVVGLDERGEVERRQTSLHYDLAALHDAQVDSYRRTEDEGSQG